MVANDQWQVEPKAMARETRIAEFGMPNEGTLANWELGTGNRKPEIGNQPPQMGKPVRAGLANLKTKRPGIFLIIFLASWVSGSIICRT
jgi:hypothetical protein